MNQSALFRFWQSCKRPLLATDSEGKVLFCNASVEKRLGLADGSLASCHVWSPFPAAQQEEIQSQFQKLPHAPEEASDFVEVLSLGGQPCRVIPMVFPEEKTVRPGWLFIMSEEGPGATSEGDRVIRALASGIAHDFNNILTGVISHLDLASSGQELPQRVLESFQYAQASARLGSELANALMTFSHRPAPKTTPLMLNNLIEDVLSRLRKTLDPRIRIQIPPADTPPYWIEADEAQLRQLLHTLCLNARDAMLRGGELTIDLQEVSFSTASPPRRAGQFARLTVIDTGEGLPASVLPRLFEPYFCSKTLGKGSGLGLANVNNIAIGHEGWVEVESQMGQGSQFHVYLPMGRFPAPILQQATPAPEEETAGLSGTETILVIDDENLVRTIIRAVLSYRGYRVTEATSGAEGIQIYAETSPPFDLVLLDVQMMEMNGWETLTRLRAIQPDLACILLSGGTEESLRDKISEYGSVAFLTKPFDNQALLQLIRDQLDARKK